MPERKNFEPYVGVTGIRFPDQAKVAIELAEKYSFGPDQDWQSMIGVLGSPQLLDPKNPNYSTKPWRHAGSMEDLVACLTTVDRAGMIDMLHLEGPKGQGSWENRVENAGEKQAIAMLTELQTQGVLPDIQLNSIISAEGIRRIIDAMGVRIVIQLRKEILERPMEEVIAYLQKAMRGISQDIKLLFDTSYGGGEPFDLIKTVELEERFRQDVDPNISVGYAGGLKDDAASTGKIRVLGAERTARKFPGRPSVDTENGVMVAGRDVGYPEVQDTVDVRRPGGKLEQYYAAMDKGLRGE